MSDILKDGLLGKMADLTDKMHTPEDKKKLEDSMLGILKDQGVEFSKETLKAFLGGILFVARMNTEAEKKFGRTEAESAAIMLDGKSLEGHQFKIMGLSIAFLLSWVRRLEAEEKSGDKFNVSQNG